MLIRMLGAQEMFAEWGVKSKWVNKKSDQVGKQNVHV